MPLAWICDQCGHQQEEWLPFKLYQVTDEFDDDDESIVLTLYLCSAKCLADYAMGLTLDFPDEEAP